jgi:hypothetical protein
MDNLCVNPFFSEKPRFFGDERHRVGHGTSGVTDAQLVSFSLCRHLSDRTRHY